MMLNSLITQARAMGARPRIHGNGFLQLDLSATVRLHVWGHPSIPRQRVHTPIHDHTFAFSSIVLKGVLRNRRYQAIPDDEATRPYWAWIAKVREGEDTILVPANATTPYHMHVEGEDIIEAGGSYFMSPGQIHESLPHGLAVSVIAKRGLSLAQGGASPRVFIPHGMQPDNEFHRYALPVEDCWRIIEDATR